MNIRVFLILVNMSSIDQYMSVCTQGLIETLGSMVIFDENQGVSDLSKYEFH